MRADGNLGGTPAYFPNSYAVWTDRPDLNEPPLPIDGAADHWGHRVDDDHWEQPGNLFRLMSPDQQQRLFDNTARQIGDASPKSSIAMWTTATGRTVPMASASPARLG